MLVQDRFHLEDPLSKETVSLVKWLEQPLTLKVESLSGWFDFSYHALHLHKTELYQQNKPSHTVSSKRRCNYPLILPHAPNFTCRRSSGGHVNMLQLLV